MQLHLQFFFFCLHNGFADCVAQTLLRLQLFSESENVIQFNLNGKCFAWLRRRRPEFHLLCVCAHIHHAFVARDDDERVRGTPIMTIPTINQAN